MSTLGADGPRMRCYEYWAKMMECVKEKGPAAVSRRYVCWLGWGVHKRMEGGHVVASREATRGVCVCMRLDVGDGDVA